MSQSAFATALSLNLARSGSCALSAQQRSGVCSARAPRRVRMAVGEAPEPTPSAGDSPSSGSFTGPPVAVLAEGDDFELPEGEEMGELTMPAEFVNAAAIAEAREKFRLHEKDTGSAEYQIATLTTKITYLTAHLKKNPKDFASTRGLVKMVSKRRRLLKFLKSEDPARFNAILEGMNIRVSQQLRSM